MESVIFKVLWFIIHLIIDIYETLYYFGLEICENFSHFIKIISKNEATDSKENQIQLIERSIRDLEKIPEHIVVILNVNNKKDVDLSQLTKLVYWSMNSGVHFISFYDYKGIIKYQLASSFYHEIQEKLHVSINENIVWGPDYQNTVEIKFPHRNGYRRHIVINLYSSQDSYEMFNRLLVDEAYKKMNHKNNSDSFEDDLLDSKNITVEKIDRKLNKLYGFIPDPELAVYFGNITCTDGLLPWKIRLTEFLQISYKQHQLSLDKYLRVLYKYAKCEQRYGK